MDKSLLKKTQPVAYQTLSHALKRGQLSHAYLFYGPKGAPKQQMALLLAQSLYCQHVDEDGFACQSCEECQRIAKEENPDFYWMHPNGYRRARPLTRKEVEAWWKGERPGTQAGDSSKYKIGKEDILAIQEAFSVTSSEKIGHQVYLIEQYDQATPFASNALLKFLEEPKDGLTGILIADELSNVLPTIVSRSQLILFRPPSTRDLKMKLLEILDDEDYATMLAQAGYQPANLEWLMENEPIFEIRDAALEYWKHRRSLSALVRLQTGIFKSKGGSLTKGALKLFLEWMLHCIRLEKKDDPEQLMEMRLAVLKSLDALRRPVDLALLLDRTCYAIYMESRVCTRS